MSGIVADIVVILIILALVIFAVYYIVREKKKGRACIGCPYSSSCSKCSCDKK